MYSTRRKLFSQNYLLNQELVEKLVRDSSIGKADTVLEIGPGKGILTQALLEQAGKVVAVELDPRLYSSLRFRFARVPNLELHHSDFLTWPLPDCPYKVFSNIPFRITSDIIRKLLRAPNPPLDSYLVVQSEAAAKWAGNNLASLLLQPWFTFSIRWRFRRTDFVPIPQVDVVLLRIEKRENPLIEEQYRTTFEDWLAYVFSRKKPYIVNLQANPTQMSLAQWVDSFHHFTRTQDRSSQCCIKGSASMLFEQQTRLEKIHRTRNDPKWKRDP